MPSKKGLLRKGEAGKDQFSTIADNVSRRSITVRLKYGLYQRFTKNYIAKGHVVYQHTQNLKQILLETRRAVRARVDFSEKNQPHCRPAVSRTAMTPNEAVESRKSGWLSLLAALE
jgi:hypothetical protein